MDCLPNYTTVLSIVSVQPWLHLIMNIFMIPFVGFFRFTSLFFIFILAIFAIHQPSVDATHCCTAFMHSQQVFRQFLCTPVSFLVLLTRLSGPQSHSAHYVMHFVLRHRFNVSHLTVIMLLYYMLILLLYLSCYLYECRTGPTKALSIQFTVIIPTCTRLLPVHNTPILNSSQTYTFAKSVVIRNCLSVMTASVTKSSFRCWRDSLLVVACSWVEVISTQQSRVQNSLKLNHKYYLPWRFHLC